MITAAAQYLREANKHLPCPNSIKKPFLRQLEDELSIFCADHAGADTATLSEHFGSPEEVAEAFLSELGEQAVHRYNRTRKRLLLLTLGVILCTVFFAVVITVQTTTLRQQLPKGEFVASIAYEAESGRNTSRDTIYDNIESPKP